MADIVNAVDLLLQSTVPRLLPVLGAGNVTVPTSNIIGLPDYYSSALRVVLRATTQAFRTFTVGGTTPASIIVTADLKNILGTVTWTLVSGTATFTTSTNTLTINAGNMSSASVVISASVTYNSVTYTDQITLINTTESSGTVLGFLTNETAIVPTLTDATVLSYTDAGGTFAVYYGTVVETGNAVTYSVVSTSGVNVSIDTNGIYTVSNLTSSTGSATIRAVFNGTTIDKTYTVIKQRVSGFDGAPGTNGTNGTNGADGATGPAGTAGTRGTVNIAVSVSASSWSDATAVTAISNNGSGSPINRDIVTEYNLSTNYSESKYYLNGTWYSLDAYINGNLLVSGTIVAAALATDSVTALKILANSITTAKIAAGAVTADKITVTSLDALTATIGLLRSRTSGARTEISNDVIKVFNDSNIVVVKLGNLDG